MPGLDWLILGGIVAIAIMVWLLGKDIIGAHSNLVSLDNTLSEIAHDVAAIRDRVTERKYDDLYP